RGTAIVRHAMELNANHAGWMHFAPLWDHFHKGEYEQALECANRVDVPGLFWPYLVMASACGHLGRHAEAAAAVRDLLALDPEYAAHARSNVGTWHFASGLMDPILESVRKAGEKLRITAQLVNVADGYHLWSEDYDGDVGDIFTFQSNVAQRVVDALQIKLGVEAARALAKKPTENPEAHRLYLLGRYEFGKYSEAGWTSSIRYYEQALKLDPNYALAYCGLADTYAYMGGVMMPSKEAVVKEKEFAQKALELDPELPEAHLSLACALAGAFDWRNAQVEFDRAIELNPNLAWAYEIYAWFLGGLGRLDEAIAKDKKAIELDPLNSFFQSALAYFLYHARRYDDAIVQIKKTLELDPASTLGRHFL